MVVQLPVPCGLSARLATQVCPRSWLLHIRHHLLRFRNVAGRIQRWLVDRLSPTAKAAADGRQVAIRPGRHSPEGLVLPEGSAFAATPTRVRAGCGLRRRAWPRGVSALLVITGVPDAPVRRVRRPFAAPEYGSSFFYDVVIANLGYAGCTALCAWRALRADVAGGGAGERLQPGSCCSRPGPSYGPPGCSTSVRFRTTSIADGCLPCRSSCWPSPGSRSWCARPYRERLRLIWIDGVIAALGVGRTRDHARDQSDRQT